MSIAVVGSANMDLVCQVPWFPHPGETVAGRGFATFCGGKGANQAVAAAKLGADVRFVGCIGDDAFGHEIRSGLDASGVRVSDLVVHESAPTGTAIILVDRSGQNQIVIAAGANEMLTPVMVEEALRAEPPEVVLFQLEIPLESVGRGVRAARDLGSVVILNPAPALPLADEIIANIDFITPNEIETEQMTGIVPVDDLSCDAAAHALLDRGAKNVVLTLGAQGCYWSDGKDSMFIPARAVKVVDSTAAGDAFNGALAVAIAAGMSVPDALGRASNVGALAVTQSGAQASLPTLDRVLAFEATGTNIS